ncbi:MAG: hypothetical protein KDD64_05280 [Bdellovibrionales bacterium]|nr:hypothetical protein [Bdellovibrionales bacterium]
MRLTKFNRLRKAVAELNTRHVGEVADELRRILGGDGKTFRSEDTAITEEAIFYIEPRSGMATKVVMYIPEQKVEFEDLELADVRKEGYVEDSIVEQFHPYHLMKCNILTWEENRKWPDPYRIAQRKDGQFRYRLITEVEGRAFHQDIPNQKLFLCQNCLLKINSLLKEVKEFKREKFELREYFDAGFEASWRPKGSYSRDRGALSTLTPEDWTKVSRVRKAQVGFICEECGFDLSKRELQRYTHTYATDHLQDKVSYIQLRCLCMGCRASKADGEPYTRRRSYQDFYKLSQRLGTPTLYPAPKETKRKHSDDPPDWQLLFRDDD